MKLKNPVIAASGTFGFGKEYSKFFDLNKLGGISVKGLTLEPRKGNEPPRIAETPGGILNSVGLQNPGVHAFIRDEIPFLREFDTAVISNVAGNTVDDYRAIVEILSDADIDAIELNVSCPNVKEGCLLFGSTAAGVFDVTDAVRKVCKKPLIVKLSPNVTDITEIARAAEAAGADCISLINTILGMSIDVEKRKPVLANVMGGLSGPAVKPVAVRMVYQTAKAVKVPIIGMGGISNESDAIEFMLAGASAVMIGTAGFVNPNVWVDTIQGIEEYIKENGFDNAADLTGALIE